jgi:hypothetical protein
MDNANHDQHCDSCKIGIVDKRMQQIAFHQWTDKGYVFCRALVPMGVCNHCGAKTWDEEAEQIIERTVRDEYDKLP